MSHTPFTRTQLVLIGLAALAIGLMVFTGTRTPSVATPVDARVAEEGGVVDKKLVSPTDKKLQAERFIEAVNNARKALAAEQRDDAKRSIDEAKAMAIKLKGKNQNVQSGRVTYNLGGRKTSEYFAVETGPVKMKNVETGPFWADKKGAAVTDAELVYVTLNLSKSKVEQRLDAAIAATDRGELAEANSELEALLKEVITIDSSFNLPVEKTRDNLALARVFIQNKNYPGARFALGHARDALDSMEDNDQYAKQKERILAMRTDLVLLQDKIARNDPTALEKAEQNIDAWWHELKDWSAPAKKK